MATTPCSLPLGIPCKPKPEDFEEPVAWLFGRQFIATFKYVLLYTAFKGKLDSRDWMKNEVVDVERLWKQSADNTETDFWFDYISDTGDGQRAMYSIAYLCMSDLAVSNNLQIGNAAEFAFNQSREELASKTLLPRGSFLFVGGDTSYHISDYGTLANRFQNPFWWAFQDLDGKANVENQRRLIFGIPGNHDYYDSLDGFNRQFRRPSTADELVPNQRPPLLMLPTFVRTQEASYVALRLPFDWWFWGLDTENGEIDFRQLEFFTEIRATHKLSKLIVATPEPTIAFGKYPDAEENQSKTFAALGLERPFLKDDSKEQIPRDKCRVDLSGDIHNYARYLGPAPVSGTGNYTSVMAGGGGAFFHPSQTNAGEVPQDVLYPAASESRNKTAEHLFKFINIWKGGYVWLFGFLIAFSLLFTAYFPRSSREAVDSFPPFVWLGISPGVRTPAPQRSANPEQLNASIWTPKPLAYYSSSLSVLVSLGLLTAALLRSRKLFKKEYDPKGTRPRKKVTRLQRAVLWLLVSASFVTLVVGIWGLQSFNTFLPTYLQSLIIFASLVWAIMAVIQSVIYSGWLFEESYSGNIRTWHYWPIWSLLIMAVGQLAASFWFFGKHESSYLISDLVQLTVLLGGLIGLSYFAVSTGGKLKKGIGKFGFLLLGISHAVLQLTVPFLLVRKGHVLWAPLAAFAIVGIYQFIGGALAKLKNGWPLALSWILFGAALLVTPFVLSSPTSLNIPDEFWPTLGLCIYAGVIGAGMSCALFGSYLAVSLAFDGHNNEAGGAARIEGFKHLIRFRLNARGLTGFVIGIDQAETEGSNLKPKIVDVFHICNR